MIHIKSEKLATGIWSTSEHERFLEAIALYPHGPWTLITEHIGTRSSKQVQTHAQKYQHKLQRHQRGLIKRKTRSSRVEHRVDKATADQLANGFAVRPANRIMPTSPLELETKITDRQLAMGGCDMPADLTQPFPGQSLSVASPTWSTSSTQSDDTASSVDFSCSSPTGLEAVFEPLPFRAQPLEEACWWETLDVMMACDLLTPGACY